MRVVMLEEHRSVPWNALPGQMVDVGDGELLSTEPVMMGFPLLTCENRRMGVGDGEGSGAFVVYSTGCQGVEYGRPMVSITRATSALLSNQGNHTSIRARPVLAHPRRTNQP
jgi:hypothetical protein